MERGGRSLRHSLVLELAEPDTNGCGVHFPEPFGRVRIGDNHAAWHPIDVPDNGRPHRAPDHPTRGARAQFEAVDPRTP